MFRTIQKCSELFRNVHEHSNAFMKIQESSPSVHFSKLPVTGIVDHENRFWNTIKIYFDIFNYNMVLTSHGLNGKKRNSFIVKKFLSIYYFIKSVYNMIAFKLFVIEQCHKRIQIIYNVWT